MTSVLLLNPLRWRVMTSVLLLNWIPSCCKRVKNVVVPKSNDIRPITQSASLKKVYILRKRGILEAIAELKESIHKEALMKKST
jgi:hypothetical protein